MGDIRGGETRYDPSLITGNGANQALAAGYQIGKRFHSAPVIRLGDAKPMQLGHVLKADGRWRLIAFAASEDDGGAGGSIAQLCSFLEGDEASPLRRYSPIDGDIDAVFDFRAVFQQSHRMMSVGALPNLLLPRKGRYGLIDYEKAFCADLSGPGDIFEMRGIDRGAGALLIVRPDQYVAEVTRLDAYGDVSSYFERFMLHV